MAPQLGATGGAPLFFGESKEARGSKDVLLDVLLGMDHPSRLTFDGVFWGPFLKENKKKKAFSLVV